MTEQSELDFIGGEEGLLHLPGWQAFNEWIKSYGGNKVMQYVYRYSAPYGRRWIRYGRKYHFRLVWEIVRDHIDQVIRDAKRKGIDVKKIDGYSLNNNFMSYAARHVLNHKPEWSGAFELRELGSNKYRRPE